MLQYEGKKGRKETCITQETSFVPDIPRQVSNQSERVKGTFDRTFFCRYIYTYTQRLA